MSRATKIKKGFTLVELLIIVIILIAVYSVYFVNLQKEPEKNNINENLIKIKSILSRYEYSDSKEIACSYVDQKCFVVIDGIMKEVLQEKLFDENRPRAYTYESRPSTISYNDLRLEEMESYPIDFIYKIDRYGKSKDMIVEVNDKVYIFNSLFDKPTVVDSMSYVFEYFENNVNKVRDVF